VSADEIDAIGESPLVGYRLLAPKRSTPRYRLRFSTEPGPHLEKRQHAEIEYDYSRWRVPIGADRDPTDPRIVGSISDTSGKSGGSHFGAETHDPKARVVSPTALSRKWRRPRSFVAYVAAGASAP
jgi:hypothetical protein